MKYFPLSLSRISKNALRVTAAMIVAGLSLGSVHQASAQSYYTAFGQYPWSVPSPVKGGYVDLADGNLHIEIPIASMPERGAIPFHAALVYDSHIWQQVTGSGSTSWEPTNVANSWGGWRMVETGNPGGVSFKFSSILCYYGHVWIAYSQYTNWVWTAPNGRQIPFLITTSTTNGCNPGTSTGTAIAADGSGYQMVVTSTTSATVYAPNGTQIYPKVEDANGNYYSTSSGSVVDTLGRTPITSSTVGSTTTYSVLNSEGSGGTYKVKVTTETIPVNTGFGQSGVEEYPSTQPPITVVSSIALPDGTEYTFGYDDGSSGAHYGTLTSMTVPTGGTATYTHTVIADTYGNNYLYLTAASWNGGDWTYAPVPYSACGTSHCEDVTVTKPNGSTGSNSEVHSFAFYGSGFWGATPWDILQRYYSGSSSLQETVAVAYTAAPYVYPQTITTTLPVVGGNLTKTKTITYTSNSMGTPQEISETEFGSSSAARTTQYTYYSGNPYMANAATTIFTSGLGASLTKTITYDGYGGSNPLGSAAGLTNHDDTNFGTSYTTRGNATSIQIYGFPATILSYNTTGEVIGSTDALGNVTAFFHDDKFYNDNGANPPSGATPPSPSTDAYLTTMTLPSPFGWHLYFGYYFGSGKLAWSEDANAHVTYYHTNWEGQDPWDRTIETQQPIGWRLTDYTSATQVDSYLGITDVSASTGCTSCRHDQVDLDSWGRVIEKSLVSDPEGADITTYSYDSASRLLTATQTARYGDGTPSETYTYDALNRAIQDAHADSTSLATYYGPNVTGAGGTSPQLCTVGSNGTGYPILAVDEAGHKRQVWIDGLGNTIEVDEPDASTGSLTKNTCYSYDALGNLLSVAQGSQSRTYTYDYLSRVLTAKTPETQNLAVTYSYTNGSAVCSANPASVCSRTNAAGYKTTYTYDALGRLTQKSYTDGTPTVTYYYDGGSGQKGYLTGMADGSGTATWTYDANGRITGESRTIAGKTKTVGYAWNEDGTPQQITYPSLRNVVYATNNAERPTAAWDAANSSVLYAYESIYSVAGVLRGTYNGHIASVWDGIYFTQSFNNRLQVNGMAAGSTAGTVESLAINYNAVGNNGNIASITNGVTSGLGENYTYDMLDRILTGATQSNTATGCWGQSFGASGAADDIYSNLTQMSVTQCTAGSLSVTVNASTNQLNSSPILYNNSGNMTEDGGGDSYVYDGENHLATASGPLVTGGTWSYIYDGNGLRVAKCNNESTSPCGGATGGTLYWRDIFGNVLSESDLSGNITNDYIYFGGHKIAQENASGTTHYIFPDQVGSTVAMTDASGNLCYSSTFTPYGEEHSTIDSCSSGGTSTNYKFTGYERDAETGLDYAFARYYSSRLGRFMSADPLSGSISNPQSLNRYAYVGNKPITRTDPTGMLWCVPGPLNSRAATGCFPAETLFDDAYGSFGTSYDDGSNPLESLAGTGNTPGVGGSLGTGIGGLLVLVDGLEPGPEDPEVPDGSVSISQSNTVFDPISYSNDSATGMETISTGETNWVSNGPSASSVAIMTPASFSPAPQTTTSSPGTGPTNESGAAPTKPKKSVFWDNVCFLSGGPAAVFLGGVAIGFPASAPVLLIIGLVDAGANWILCP